LTHRPPPSALTRRLTSGFATLGALALVTAAWPAFADLVDAYFPPGILSTAPGVGVTVTSRERPKTDRLGIRVGSFIFRPEVGVAGGVDSNPLFQAHGPASTFAETTGSLGVTSNWSRDNVGALLTFDDTRYFGVARQDTTNWSFSFAKSFDFGADRLTLSATHLALHQTARDLNTGALDEPGAYSVDNLRMEYKADRGDFTFLPRVQFTRYQYDDISIGGVRQSQKYRNRNILDGELTTKYAMALLRDFAVVLRGASIQYDTARPGQPRPDANVLSALVGVDHATSAVWRYRLLVGVQARQAQSSAVKSRTEPIAEANVIWSPSGLTTWGFTLTRAVQDSAGEFASAYTYTEGKLTVDHELARDILLHGQIGFQQADYEQGHGRETVVSAAGGVTWLVNRNARVSGTYSYLRKSGVGGEAIDESIAMIRLQLGI
jgi:hypothetical protein